MKVALLHDWLIRYGGAERVLTVLHGMFPDSPIYFLLAREDLIKKHFPDARIHTSFLDRIPGFFTWSHRMFLPLYPGAVESFDFSQFGVFISSCSTFIKGVVTRPSTIHISYIHTPPRFLWDWKNEYSEELGRLRRFVSFPLFHSMRLWDSSAAGRPDYLIANSQTTRARIQKYYRREAGVIYPPVSLASRFDEEALSGERNAVSYFLIVSQLVPYKRIDLAIRVCNAMNLPLIIVGEGPERKKLERMAGPAVTFMGWQPDDVVRSFYQNATAVLFPGEDDFGIVPVEAMSFGRPVLAFRGGGATETVVEGITGEFFDEPTPESLKIGLERILTKREKYDPALIQKRARKFSKERFIRELRDFIKTV